MREILFRGKRTDNGEWVTGTPFIFADRCKMIQAVAVHPDFVDDGNVYYSEGYPVDPETVGQFTGLTDKNSKKIFEGDVVRFEDVDGEMVVCMVLWGENGGRWELDVPATGNRFAMSFFDVVVEVIGNIHDNPELLEGEFFTEDEVGDRSRMEE